MKGIKVSAVLIALFAFYIVPILPLGVLTSIPNFFGTPEPIGERIPISQSVALLVMLWFWSLAPVGSGYFAAKLALRQPLLHGLVTGAVGAVIVVVWMHGSWIFDAILALFVLCCGLFGGWLWRYRSRNSAS